MNSDVIKYNIVKFVCFFFVIIFFQQIAGGIDIWGITPNIAFLLILSAAIAEPHKDLIYPCIFGIIYDHMNGNIFGVYTILFVLISFFANELYHKNFEDVVFVEIIFIILGCFFYSFITAVFISLMDGGFWSVVIRVSLPEFVYNSIVGTIVCLIYKKIITKSAGGRRRGRRRSAWRV